MKIAYIGQMADVSRESSIAKKIRDQTGFWLNAGHEVRYFALTPDAHTWPDLAAILSTHLVTRGPLWLQGARSRELCQAIRAWKPNLIYFRYAYHAPGLPALFRDIPCVAEINSDDQREYPLTLGPLKNLYHRLTRRRILRTVSGFVPVTRELARAAADFSRPMEVIANAIPLDELPALPLVASVSNEPRLVFVGSPRTPWHGLDRIAELARLFPAWGFDVIGDDTESWSDTVSTPPPANLHLHGQLTRDRYLPLMTAATAALGTLGLYRKGMHEACPLKVREYLALGLPVIGGCADTDIPDDADYYLRLPNDVAPLASHRDAIAAFLERWRGRRVPREAIAHLDTSVKETRRLAFMARVAADWRTARDLPSPAP